MIGYPVVIEVGNDRIVLEDDGTMTTTFTFDEMCYYVDMLAAVYSDPKAIQIKKEFLD